MASIRAIAQEILPDARAEIAWIAFYKKGRGWGAQCFFPDFDDQTGTFTFDPDDAALVEEILSIDENAIFVNPYYSNLGPSAEEGMTRETLANGLRWPGRIAPSQSPKPSRSATTSIRLVSARSKSLKFSRAKPRPTAMATAFPPTIAGMTAPSGVSRSTCIT